MLKMYVLDLGRMRIDKNFFINHAVIANSEEPNKPNEYIEFPIQAFMFKGKEGYILYDTGVHPDSMGQNGRWPIEFQVRSPYIGNDECSILNRLKQLGLEPDDISWVILSHMHNDHAGCIEYFNKSNFLVNENEFNACMQAYATHDYLSSYIWKDTDVWTRKKRNWHFVEEKDGDIEVMPGLTVLNFGPGHAHGMLGLHVSLEKSGNIIITSDALYCRENFSKPFSEPGIVYDTVGWCNTAKRIRYLSTKLNAQVWFGHDMEQFKSLKKSTEGSYS